MCYIHRINFQSIYQWPGISDTTWGKLYKIAPSVCLVLWHCKGPTHLLSSSLLSCKSQNLQTPLCDVAYIFCLRTWRVPAKDDFIQTSCDKDLGKHRILFTQVVVNNMSHQSWIYDKQPQLSKISTQNQLVDYWEKEEADSLKLSTDNRSDISHLHRPHQQICKLNETHTDLHQTNDQYTAKALKFLIAIMPQNL